MLKTDNFFLGWLGGQELLILVVGGVIGLFIYFLPSIIAQSNKKSNASSIFILNLFLGWSVLGWIIFLAMAVSKDKESTVVQQVVQPSQVQSESVAEELEKLVDLKERGAITEEEFQAQKAKIL